MAELPELGDIKMRKADPVWIQRATEARLTRLTRTLGGRYDITVRINDQGMAATDGNTVWLPRRINPDPAANLICQEAIAAHEAAGHLRYTCFKSWKAVSDDIQAGKEEKTLHHMTNILEDARVNHLLSQDYAGSGKHIDFTHDLLYPKYLEQLNNPEVNERVKAMSALAVECIAHKAAPTDSEKVKAFMDDVRPLLHGAISQPNTKAIIEEARILLAKFREYFPADGSSEMAEDMFPEEFDGMLDDHSPEQLENMRRMQTRVKVDRKVKKDRFSDMKETTQEEAEAAQKAQEEGDSCDGEGQDGEGEGTSKEGEGKPGDGDSQGKGNGKGDGEEIEPEDYEDRTGEGQEYDEVGEVVGGIDESSKDKKKAPSEGSMNQQSSGATEEYWDILAEADDIIKDMDIDAINLEERYKGEVEAADGGLEITSMGGELDKWGHEIKIGGTPSTIVRVSNMHDSVQRYNRTVNRYETTIRTLVAEIKKRLSGKESDYLRMQRRGKVDSRSVWNAEASDRIFRKRIRIKRPEAAGILLIDASGSMGGGGQTYNRAYYASEAAIVMSEVMARCGFHYEVVDFNSSSGGRNGEGYTNMNVRKPLSGKPNEIAKAAISTDHVGYGNSDGHALQWCIDRLRTVEADSKFVFVISDGAPAGPSPSGMNAWQHLTEVVNACPSDISLCSVGIDGCQTKTWYGERAADITRASELGEVVVPVLRKTLRGIKRKVVSQ